MGDGGQILSQQTNIALDALRAAHGSEDDAWGVYLQCDELIHEDEVARIKEDIEVALSKRWYPHEVRAIKLKSDIKSFGDAQGFSGVTKSYESECRILHYGHVREARA